MFSVGCCMTVSNLQKLPLSPAWC